MSPLSSPPPFYHWCRGKRRRENAAKEKRENTHKKLFQFFSFLECISFVSENYFRNTFHILQKNYFEIHFVSFRNYFLKIPFWKIFFWNGIRTFRKFLFQKLHSRNFISEILFWKFQKICSENFLEYIIQKLLLEKIHIFMSILF